jgi:hypothetical protein
LGLTGLDLMLNAKLLGLTGLDFTECANEGCSSYKSLTICYLKEVTVNPEPQSSKP